MTYGDDIVGIRYGRKIGLSHLFSCYFVSHGIYSGCSRCTPGATMMPPRQRMRFWQGVGECVPQGWRRAKLFSHDSTIPNSMLFCEKWERKYRSLRLKMVLNANLILIQISWKIFYIELLTLAIPELGRKNIWIQLLYTGKWKICMVWFLKTR